MTKQKPLINLSDSRCLVSHTNKHMHDEQLEVGVGLTMQTYTSKAVVKCIVVINSNTEIDNSADMR